jgi:hypothetical protein
VNIESLSNSPCSCWATADRARRCPIFLVTEAHFRELHRPPVVTEEMMEEALGHVPGLLTPPGFPEDRIRRLLELAEVAIAA